MKVKIIKPNPNCKFCRGTGYDFLQELCDCLPLNYEERVKAIKGQLVVQVDSEEQNYTGQQSTRNQ